MSFSTFKFKLYSHNVCTDYFFYLEVITYIIFYFQIQVIFKQKSSLRFSDIVVVSYYRRLFLSASVKTLICHIKMNLSNSNIPSLADK